MSLHTRRMTDRARRVMSLANDQSVRLNCPDVRPEHVLLALAEEGIGVAAHVLMRSGVDFQRLKRAAALNLRKREVVCDTSPLPLSSTTEQLLARAEAECAALGHGYIGTEHLLLGLTSMPATSAHDMLASLGVSSDTVRQEVLSILGHDLA